MIHLYKVKNYLWTAIVAMFILVACLSGCSTVAGVGKDIQSSAEWTKDKMSGK